MVLERFFTDVIKLVYPNHTLFFSQEKQQLVDEKSCCYSRLIFVLLIKLDTVICFQNCPKLVHNLMLNCWESDKIRRPTFAEIVDNIDKFLRSPEDLNDGLSAVTEKYVTLQLLLRSSVFWESALFVVRATQLFCRSKNI